MGKDRFCENCDREFTAYREGLEQRFCSPDCRREWWDGDGALIEKMAKLTDEDFRKLLRATMRKRAGSSIHRLWNRRLRVRW